LVVPALRVRVVRVRVRVRVRVWVRVWVRGIAIAAVVE